MNKIIFIILISIFCSCKTYQLKFPSGTNLLLYDEGKGSLYGDYNKRGVLKYLYYINNYNDTTIVYLKHR